MIGFPEYNDLNNRFLQSSTVRYVAKNGTRRRWNNDTHDDHRLLRRYPSFEFAAGAADALGIALTQWMLRRTAD